MRFSIMVFAMAAGLALAMPSTPAKSADPAYLVIGAGTWETLRDGYRKGELDVAYRSNYALWIFKPQAGLLVAGDGDFFGYTGLYTDIYWGSHIVTTLSATFGGYGGGGYDLGSHFEFRTGGDVAWRFADTSRLGIGFYHISNAGITRRNPGSESLLLQYSLPLTRLFPVANPPPAVAATHFNQ
jgi:hypothetical protein